MCWWPWAVASARKRMWKCAGNWRKPWAASWPLPAPWWKTASATNAHQIGLSGRTVRPKLLITCGVSGAIQFTSCMTGSECIVAINSDPEAQIFGVAHYCIVDDLYRVVPKLTELVRNRKED